MHQKLALIATITLVALGIFLALLNLGGRVFYSVAAHSLIEGISAFCSLFLALFFLLVKKLEGQKGPYLASASGLLCMGVLDLFHAMTSQPNVFVWLRSMASFIGALGFSLIWFNGVINRPNFNRLVTSFFFTMSLTIAFFSATHPDSIPAMISEGGFTPLAYSMHVISGFLFLLASFHYFFLHPETFDESNFFLGSFCILQSLASFLFSFCNVWSLEWWWWHVLRSLAGIVLIFYVFYVQLKLQRKLELSVTLRDEFIAIASHELKTPLSAMKLQAQMLHRYENQKDKFEWMTKMFNKEINRITKVVDELLEISRITSGQLSMNRSESNLGQVVRETIYLLQEEFESAKQDIQTEIEDDVTGNWDELRLSQVVINFLTNAKRYGEGKPIIVKVYKDNNQAVLSVKDHGIGISEEDQAKLFHRFERLKRDRNVSGLGMGLFITRKIAEAHSGRIEIISTPGQGSEFRFIFPISK